MELEVEDFAVDNNFTLDRRSGRIDVGIRMPASQVSQLRPSFFGNDAVKRYLARAPDVLSSTCYLGFGWRVDAANVLQLVRCIARKLR